MKPQILGILLLLLAPSWAAAADPACLAKPPGLLGWAETFRGTPIGIKVQGSYAFVGDWGRYSWGVFQSFDVSDPCAPVRKAMAETVFPARNEIGDLTIVGNRAYLANDGNGVTLYDIANPAVALPFLNWRVDATYAHAIHYDGARYLYVGNLMSPGRSLQIYDSTAFPAQPPASYNAYLNRDVIAVYTRGNRAYLFTSDGSTAHGLEILNITNPMAPTRISTVLLTPSLWGDTAEVRVNGDYLYIMQKNFGAVPGGLRIFNIANETAPVLAGRLDIADTGSMDWKGSGLEVLGNTVYIGTKAGLGVVSVANPAAPVLMRTFPIPAAFGNAMVARVEIHGPLAYATIYNLDLPSQKGGLAIYKLYEASNLDSSLTLVSQTGVRETAGPCLPAQIFRVNATWRNNGVPLASVYATATTLTNGTLVTNAIGQTADGVISTNEQFPGVFRIQLAACTPFQFRVSLWGFPINTGGPGFRLTDRGSAANRDHQDGRELLGEFVFDETVLP